jgi:hypothetical protein
MNPRCWSVFCLHLKILSWFIGLHQLSVALVVILAAKNHKTIRENPNKALIVYPVNNKKAGK